MSIEDKLAIHEVIARYSYTYDSNDADGFAQLFVEDGVFEIFVAGETSPSVHSGRGRRFASGPRNDCKSVADDSPADTTNPAFCSMSYHRIRPGHEPWCS